MKLVAMAAVGLLLVLALPASGEVYVNGAPDRVFNLVMNGHTINGFVYPDTPILEAALGDLVQMTVTVPITAEPHTFHVHGHPWFQPSHGRTVDTVLIQPGEVYSFNFRAGGADAEPGDWMYHCHFDDHMSGGMWGLLRVHPFLAIIETPETSAGALVVKLEREGAPVEGPAAFAVTLNGEPVPAHALRLAPGHYALHTVLAPDAAGVLVVVATTSIGESVARAGLGGVEVPTPTIRSQAPPGATPHAGH